MARSFSTSQEDVLNSKKYDVLTLLEVEDSTGAFVDIGTLGGANWLEGARWDWDIDRPVPEITLKIRRDQGPSTGESLAPLDEDSTFNRNAASAYAPLLDVGREIRFYTATLAAGSAAPATSDFDWVFQGEIDDVKWPKSPIEVVARTKIMSRLNDQWIETVTEYGSTAGVAIQTVMQSILDDHIDLGITLSVPVSPGFNISPAYLQQKENVLDALTTLAQLIGWQIREVFSSTEWVLELSEPRRGATSSETDWTFGGDDYFDVNAMALSRDDVRNAVSVIFGAETSSGRAKILTESTGSIDSFGRRWMEIEEGFGSSINTSSEANTLANSVLSDLDQPPAQHEIEVPYWWPGELGDYYAFEANEIHYSVDQFFGVYGLSHVLERNKHRTVVRVRGQPAGQYLAWQRYPGGGNPATPLITGIEIAFDENGNTVVSAAGNDETVDMFVTVGNDIDPADPSTSDSTISGRQGTVNTGTKVTTGNTAHVKVAGTNEASGLGPVKSVQHQRKIGPFHKDVTSRATNSSGPTTLETVTVPAGKLGDDGVINFKGFIDFDGTNASKVLLIYWNTILKFSNSFENNAAFADFDLMLMNVGTSTSQYMRLRTLDTNDNVLLSENTALDATATSDAIIEVKAVLNSTLDTFGLEFTLANYIGTD